MTLTVMLNLEPILNRFSSWPPRLFGLSCMAVLLCLSLPVFAEQPIAEITLQQAVEKSLQTNPALAAYQYRLESAAAYAQQATVGEKPELHLILEDAFGTGEHTAIDNAQSTLSISWVLQGGLLEQRFNTGQSKLDVVELERDIQRYDIAAQTAHAFLNVLAYQEKLVVAKTIRQHAVEMLHEIRDLVDAGRFPLADKLQAEVNLQRRELDVEDIRHELVSAKKILASQWGSTEIDFTRAGGAMALSGQLLSYDELEQGISSNPEIRYFLTQQRVLDSEITLAEEEAKNRWRFIAGVRRYETTNDFGATFGVTLPLGKASRNQYQVSALTAEQERYRADARAKEIQLTTQLFVLYAELEHSYHLNEAFSQNILPRLQRALAETQEAYSLGRYSYREWYALQTEVLDTRMELINVRLKAHNNITEIERLTGLRLTQVTPTMPVLQNTESNYVGPGKNGDTQ